MDDHVFITSGYFFLISRVFSVTTCIALIKFPSFSESESFHCCKIDISLLSCVDLLYFHLVSDFLWVKRWLLALRACGSKPKCMRTYVRTSDA